MRDLFHLEQERQKEAERRFKMLGDYADRDYTTVELLDLARQRFIPRSTLMIWKDAYLRDGLNGLLPRDWSPLSEKSQCVVAERLAMLQEVTETLIVTEQDLRRIDRKLSPLGSTTGRLSRKTERLVRRYRVGGLWGLAPEQNPEKKHAATRLLPELATYAETDEALFQEIERRRDCLGEALLTKIRQREKISDQEVKDRAQEKHMSRSRLWDYIHDLRVYSTKGLAPRTRSDKGCYHNLSARMEHLIRGLRLSKRDMTLSEIREEAGKRARVLGEPEPSAWHVRTICQRIPPEVLALADGRERDFRDNYRTTHQQWFDGRYVIYQLDSTRVDVLVKDTRETGYAKKSGEVRPWVTLCLESSTDAIVAAVFSFEDPNEHNVAATIREALLHEDRPVGGIPRELWVDRGKAMISRHVRRITKELGIHLHPCFTPEQKGKVERIFGTLNTRLWARQEGYVASNVQERNPKAKAALTLPELVQRFWEFVERYHQEVVEETGKSRLETWAESCLTLPVEDPRQLDALLAVFTTRVVGKEHIQYARRMYWDKELPKYLSTGETVQIRAAPDYTRPDEIQVYDLHGQWLGTAVATDSVRGREVTGQDVAEAQRNQRARDRLAIREAQASLQAVDQEIAQRKQEQGQSLSPAPAPAEEPSRQTESAAEETEGVLPGSADTAGSPGKRRASRKRTLPAAQDSRAMKQQPSQPLLIRPSTAASAWERLAHLEQHAHAQTHALLGRKEGDRDA